MILLPAIDILDGKAVRLRRGDFEQRTVYDADPLDAARRWVEAGARALHVVDLDGARDGAPVNLEHVRRIASSLSVPVQLGGGLRSTDAVQAAFDAGATRAVLGTAALRDRDFLDAAISHHGDRIVVSVDGRDGKVAAAGWTDQTEIPVDSVIESLGSRGVKSFVFSSIERDGTLSGPDLDEVTRVSAAVPGAFVYSGGVSTLDDLRALARLALDNLTGVIVGTALYEQRFDVAAAQAALEG